jgi:hypothetical protein
MANGGIIGPVNDPTISDLTQTFTASGTFNMPNSAPAPGQVDYLVVAGGGGGVGQNQVELDHRGGSGVDCGAGQNSSIAGTGNSAHQQVLHKEIHEELVLDVEVVLQQYMLKEVVAVVAQEQ